MAKDMVNQESHYHRYLDAKIKRLKAILNDELKEGSKLDIKLKAIILCHKLKINNQPLNQPSWVKDQ